MTKLQRTLIALAIMLSALWGGGLFVMYMLRAKPASPPVIDHPAAGAVWAASMPTPVAKQGLPTLAQKREYLTDFWSAANNSQTSNQPHGLWEDSTGVILPPPAPIIGGPSLDATPISIHLKSVSLRSALGQLGKAANLQLILSPSWVWRQFSFPAITLDAEHRPLLEVINELCSKAALTSCRSMDGNAEPVSNDPKKPLLALHPQAPGVRQGPWVVSGKFAFEAVQVMHYVSVSPLFNQPDSLHVTLRAEHEPQLTVLAMQQEAEVTKAVDENSHSLLPPAPTGQSATPAKQTRPRSAGGTGLLNGIVAYFTGGTPTHQVVVPQPPSQQWADPGQQILLPLHYPPGAGKKIALLDATARFLVQVQSQQLEATVAGAPITKSLAGVTVQIAKFMLSQPQFSQCNITFLRGKQSEADWQILQAALRGIRPRLLDAAGKALPYAQVNMMRQDNLQVSVEYTWQQQQYNGNETFLTPAKLEMDVPSEWRVVAVPFEFKELPLP